MMKSIRIGTDGRRRIDELTGVTWLRVIGWNIIQGRELSKKLF
jgi:hypothetical protein